jgi:hypothetical protein
METVGKINSIELDYVTHQPIITLKLKSQYQLASEEFEELKGLDSINIKLSKPVYHRSPKANSYSWVLIEKLATKLDTSKEEIYEKMLQRYGVLLKSGEELVSIVTSQDLTSTPDLHLKYWGTKNVNGTVLKVYLIIKGSSQYNSVEMYHFITGIKSECDDLGIETKTPEEIRALDYDD